MQHAIGDHALLADGRTAALVDPDGNVAWLCWPRIDSAPVLLSLLDQSRGGRFSLRPAAAGAVVESRRYHADSLVLETTWEVGGRRLMIDDALLWQTPAQLVRRMRSDGGDVEVELCFAPSFAGGDSADIAIDDRRVLAFRGDQRLVLCSPSSWDVHGGTAVSRFVVSEGGGAQMASLASLQNPPVDTPAAAVDDTLRAWRSRLRGLSDAAFAEPALRALGATQSRALVRLSSTVLIGLRQRDGGIVAAPTTSLPQWPGSARTWDYRYCWLRDAALAGAAFVRAGLVEEASSLGQFLGRVIENAGPSPLVRVDGSEAPVERLDTELAGYRGARPVRFGNAAAHQPQLDVTGEVIEFAAMLAARDALPDDLAAAVTRLAGWTVTHWQEPDHGIWEIRGRPRHYTHSRVMAWAGLRRAAQLAAEGRVAGDDVAWLRCADAVRATTLRRGPAVLQLHDEGGGADAALTVIPGVGFLRRDDPVLLSTLELIAARLERNGVIDRYEGQRDELADPCAPFVFPTFWMAAALNATGRDGERYLRAAAASRGALDLFGECADPTSGGPLGNYPQVQSHAACILTLLADPNASLSSSS